jgi:hypothetical protein
VPHAAIVVPGTHAPDELQQPFGQLAASHVHAPPRQISPRGHVTQAEPLAPHSEFVAGSTQVVPLQQPPEQSPGLQYATHA